MAQVKKLSIKTVFGPIDIKALVNAPGERLYVMRAGGRCIGTKEGVTTQSDGSTSTWKGLVGDFVAYSGATGEEQRAPFLFLPDVALNPVLVALSQAPQGVSFLFDIFVKYAPQNKGAVKYEFEFEPVFTDKASDPIADVLSKAPPVMIGGKPVGGTLALEAPKKDAAAPAAPKARK